MESIWCDIVLILAFDVNHLSHSLIFVLSISDNESRISDFRELESTSNEMCIEMGIRPKVYDKNAPWSTEEDLRLEMQVGIHGEGKWSELYMPGRTPIELRHRWHSPQRVSSLGESNNKRYNKNPFTEQEDALLRSLVTQVPPSSKIPWQKVLVSFSNRKTQDLQNRWSRHLVPLADVVLSAVASAAVVLAAFMTPGVDGAADDKTLLAGVVIVLRGDLGEMDTDPLSAHAKLMATLGIWCKG